MLEAFGRFSLGAGPSATSAQRPLTNADGNNNYVEAANVSKFLHMHKCFFSFTLLVLFN